ncbi:hypothetical protein [Endozoicomonas sp. Mp262]|uniref:hypothetical protein n=1 Tax=Endozoicomonas sp. Mp262 TaxID=2919499 RepID=UPI0021D9C2A5
MSNSPIAAASATYRKATNKIAEAAKLEPRHTANPSDDFLEIVEDMSDAMKTKALDWYERGIKRGMKKATDLMLDGKIYREENIVYAPEEIAVKARIKFSGGEWQPFQLNVKAKDIGFDA